MPFTNLVLFMLNIVVGLSRHFFQILNGICSVGGFLVNIIMERSGMVIFTKNRAAA